MAEEGSVDVGDIYKRISDNEAQTGRLDEKVDAIAGSIADIQSSMHTIASGSQVPYIPIIMIILAIIVPGALAFNQMEELRQRAVDIELAYRADASRYHQEQRNALTKGITKFNLESEGRLSVLEEKAEQAEEGLLALYGHKIQLDVEARASAAAGTRNEIDDLKYQIRQVQLSNARNRQDADRLLGAPMLNSSGGE